MASFKEVISNPDVRAVHYQPKRTFLPHMSERGTFQADLLFLEGYRHQNNGYVGLLTVVNVPSRFGYAVPFKSKSDTTVAFQHILEEAHRNGQEVKRLETDNGGEFLNKSFQDLLKKHNVEHTTGVAGDHRFTSIVERWNGSIRNWIEIYLTKQDKNRWIDVVPEIVQYYNERKHRTLGVSPESMTKADEDSLRKQMYDATEQARDEINSISPGDRVRVLLHKKAFGKGRLRWSDNVYTVKERVPHSYTFMLEETKTPVKYSDLQLVGPDARDISEKAPETQRLAANRAHALRLGRSGLARGPREAEKLIEKVGPISDAPLAIARAPRARRAPAWQNDYDLGGVPPHRDDGPSAPPSAPAQSPSIAPRGSRTRAPKPVMPVNAPMREQRVRKAPVRYGDYQM